MKVNQKGWRGLSAPRHKAGLWLRHLLCALAFLGIPSEASAFEIRGGVGVGGILAGVEPRLAVSPHVGVLWSFENGFAISLGDQFSILPATNSIGVGFGNQVSGTVGFAWKTGDFSLGPTLSLYSMPLCGAEWCGRVVGLSPGGYGQVNLYFAGPLGVSVGASVGFVGGNSLAVSGVVAAMVVAGPVFRWSSR